MTSFTHFAVRIRCVGFHSFYTTLVLNQRTNLFHPRVCAVITIHALRSLQLRHPFTAISKSQVFVVQDLLCVLTFSIYPVNPSDSLCFTLLTLLLPWLIYSINLAVITRSYCIRANLWRVQSALMMAQRGKRLSILIIPLHECTPAIVVHVRAPTTLIQC